MPAPDAIRFFVPLTTHSDPHAEPGQPGWEQALEALRALASAEPASGEGGRRLLWALTLEPDGAVATIEPLEQVQTQRIYKFNYIRISPTNLIRHSPFAIRHSLIRSAPTAASNSSQGTITIK